MWKKVNKPQRRSVEIALISPSCHSHSDNLPPGDSIKEKLGVHNGSYLSQMWNLTKQVNLDQNDFQPWKKKNVTEPDA